MTPDDMRKKFDLPAGLMMKEFGLMTEDDFDTVGQWQATMLVLRNAAEDPSNPLQAADLPQGRDGSPDLFGLLFQSEAEIKALSDKAGITQEQFDAAMALANPRGAETPLNTPENSIKIPFVGPVIKKLCVDQDTYEASVTMQQAIRAADTALRMMHGESDPSLHEKKREFGFKNPKEDQRLQDTVALHEKFSVQESNLEAGVAQNIDAEDVMAINEAFNNAVEMFEAAGQKQLANLARQVWAQNNVLFGLGNNAPEADHSPEQP